MAKLNTRTTSYFKPSDCLLDEFIKTVQQTLDPAQVPNAASIEKNIPVYDGAEMKQKLADHSSRQDLMSEWADVLMNASGVFVVKNTYSNCTAIDQATQIYNAIIQDEKTTNGGADHFSAAGNNDRVWNSLQKLCEKSPEVFVSYFANETIQAICEAWLGPNYQMTAQINLVRPGGQAQQAHRDYHLGFQTADVSAQYPAHVHDLSPVLTLQGAIAHSDMPLESGPTKLLPYSQLYRAGYAAWRLEDFRDYFEKNFVQLPLAKGDTLFFNPALFHGAGSNTSKNIDRMANLVQVSSAFGRAMETIDRSKMSALVFPTLQAAKKYKSLTQNQIDAAIAACAEGYSFPTNLDRDPPVGGLAPETQQALLRRALDENWTTKAFKAALAEQANRQRA